ncbi:MAG: hypothetical protein PHO26_02005 [Dehalococcoidia bacterium]|nr:hypothetical protein [Dehalococcoidia bacterium]MDD5494936.1 hypothetical protein [Dehalococcoidia bacterium]
MYKYMQWQKQNKFLLFLLLVPLVWGIFLGFAVNDKASELDSTKTSNLLPRNSVIKSIDVFPPRVTPTDSRINISLVTESPKYEKQFLYVSGDNVSLSWPIEINPGEDQQDFSVLLPYDKDHQERWVNTKVYVSATPHQSSPIAYVEVTPVNQSTVQYLVTVTAIVIAVLSLWAQLTLKYLGIEEKNEADAKSIATITLYWIYTAIGIAILALIAFSLTYSSFKVSPYFIPMYFIGMGLLTTPIFMIAISVLEAFTTLFLKLFNGMTAFSSGPLPYNVTIWSSVLIPPISSILAASWILFFAYGNAAFLILLGFLITCGLIFYIIYMIEYIRNCSRVK